MKNPKRIRAHRPSVQSYRHFTGILASGMIYTNKSNHCISIGNFAHRQVYLWVECPENFSSKECFLSEILKSQKTHSPHQILEFSSFFESLISQKENTLLSWNFQGILLTNAPVYGQNFRLKYGDSICWYISCQKLKFQWNAYNSGQKAYRPLSFWGFSYLTGVYMTYIVST
jgi:hypothetical protein